MLEQGVSLDSQAHAPFTSTASARGLGVAAAGKGPFQVTAALATHPLTVSGVQREPQGDGTALPPGDGLHSVWVFGARGESHGPSTLGLHLCLQGTKQGHRTDCNLPSEETWSFGSTMKEAPQPGFPGARAKEKVNTQRSNGHGSKPPGFGTEHWPQEDQLAILPTAPRRFLSPRGGDEGTLTVTVLASSSVK